MNKLFEKSLAEVNTRQQDMPVEQREQIARRIAVGALRYFLLKYARNSVIAFDFGEALSFEGETGPYLQYSVVRANNIFRKLESQAEASQADWKSEVTRLSESEDLVSPLLADDETWSLLMLIARMDDLIGQSVMTMEVSNLAKHSFTVAQQFNLFYHRHHILSEADCARKSYYLAVADISRLGLLKMLDILGIEVPDKM